MVGERNRAGEAVRWELGEPPIGISSQTAAAATQQNDQLQQLQQHPTASILPLSVQQFNQNQLQQQQQLDMCSGSQQQPGDSMLPSFGMYDSFESTGAAMPTTKEQVRYAGGVAYTAVLPQSPSHLSSTNINQQQQQQLVGGGSGQLTQAPLQRAHSR